MANGGVGLCIGGAFAQRFFGRHEVFVGDSEKRGQPRIGEGDGGCGLWNLIAPWKKSSV